MNIKINIKIFAVIFVAVFLIGGVKANIIADIALDGALSFLDPNMQTIIKGVMCVTSPIGAVTCIEQYIEGKIVGYISGKVMEQISKISPEAYKAITTYNEIKGYIDKGAEILNELQINENGEIEEGIISFGEDEYSLIELFSNSTAEDIVVSNADYDFETRELEIKENGFLKIKVKDKDGNIRELKYDKIDEGGYFKFDEKGEIEEADIISNDKTIYEFGNYEPVSVDPLTRVTYIDGKLRVRGNILNYGDLDILLNSSVVNNFIEFNKKQISCADCTIGEIRLRSTKDQIGVLEKTDKGDIIKSGEAIYKKNLIEAYTPVNEVLIANFNADLSDYGGNWIRQTDNSLEIKSSEDGVIFLRILERHEILNTDNKDDLSVRLFEGDGLVFEKRSDNGLIPKVSHESSDKGVTKIENDGIKITLNKEDIIISPPLVIDTLVSPDEKYQSVALEIESDSESMAGKKLRINSYNQFVMLSKGDKELISYNKYDLPVSASIKDNSLQTIEQLREKYPGVEFKVLLSSSRGKGGDFERIFDEQHFPPYYVYLTDNFFQEYPDALDDIGKIIYSEGGGTNAMLNPLMTDKEGIQLGKSVDPYNTEGWPVGKILLPMQVMIHEWEHVRNNLIGKEEFALFSDAPQSKKLSGVYNKIARDAKDKLSKNQEFKEAIKGLYENSEKDYVKLSLNSLIEGKYHKDIFSYIKEDLGNAELGDKTKEEISKEYEKNPNEINGLIISKLLSLYKPEEELTDDEWKEWNQISSVKEINDVGKEVLTKWNAPDIDKYIKSAYFGEQTKIVDDIIRINSGLPYSYSLRNYAEGVSEAYLELSTTYREQPIEQRRLLVQSANKVISDTYKKLTQLAFDSGKMDVEEFKAIMGSGFCKKADCSDKICAEYKLLCCRKHYFSPNC